MENKVAYGGVLTSCTVKVKRLCNREAGPLWWCIDGVSCRRETSRKKKTRVISPQDVNSDTNLKLDQRLI